MQKHSWIYTIAAAVLGALDLLFRWLQCQSFFDAETGLPARGSALSAIVVVLLVLTVGALWWLSGKLSPELRDVEPETALYPTNRLIGALVPAAGVLAAIGAAVMFFTEEELLLRITALAGLLAAAALGLYPSLPRWGGFGAALSVVPVVFFSLWLVVFYRANATDPIVWEYGVEVLGIAGCLLGAFRLCGLLFYRTKPRQSLFAVGLGLSLAMTELMDLGSAGERIVFFGWALGFGALCWALSRNFDVQGPLPTEAAPKKETQGKEA